MRIRSVNRNAAVAHISQLSDCRCHFLLTDAMRDDNQLKYKIIYPIILIISRLSQVLDRSESQRCAILNHYCAFRIERHTFYVIMTE